MSKQTPLKQRLLKPETRQLFNALSKMPSMGNFILIGGTALALQIAHRVSNDLDFAVFNERLPFKEIDGLVSALQMRKHKVQLITSHEKISAFKINTGENLLNYVRDYAIDNVKVTFFTLGKTPKQREFFKNASVVRPKGFFFGLLGVDGLKVAKTLVLGDRVRSRDIYDLMVLVRDHRYCISDILHNAQNLGINNDPEYYKAVMTGKIPLDREDEGLEAVGVKVVMPEIYAFFRKAISEYEINISAQFFRSRSR